MIVIISHDADWADDLAQSLAPYAIPTRLVAADLSTAVSTLYDPMVVAFVVDDSMGGLQREAWIDLLNGIGRRRPVVVVGQGAGPTLSDETNHADTILWSSERDASTVVAMLDTAGCLNEVRLTYIESRVPVLNMHAASAMLRQQRWLCLVLIDASPLRKLAFQYGHHVYQVLEAKLQHAMMNVWGKRGVIRATDIVCRSSLHSHTYQVFLGQPRRAGAFPTPGAIERVVDRLLAHLHTELRELLHADRVLAPSAISQLPDIGIGYASTVYNPALSAEETIESLVRAAHDDTVYQVRRLSQRRRELLQVIMHDADILVPNYQGIFLAQDIDRSMVEATQDGQNVGSLIKSIFGFESLIRVRKEWLGVALPVEELAVLSTRFLSPDVLFTMAIRCDVALELDQACLIQAARHGTTLPGILFLNILPRNLYYVDRLRPGLERKTDLTFEVSESEAIANAELMVRVRETLRNTQTQLALDDVGQGYAGLDRILTLKPDIIKMDRALVSNIHRDKAKALFARGLMDASRTAGCKILAEGIETWDEFATLRKMGVDLVQGYLFHRPQPAQRIMSALSGELAKQVA